jgi:hypothetical protein
MAPSRCAVCVRGVRRAGRCVEGGLGKNAAGGKEEGQFVLYGSPDFEFVKTRFMIQRAHHEWDRLGESKCLSARPAESIHTVCHSEYSPAGRLSGFAGAGKREC